MPAPATSRHRVWEPSRRENPAPVAAEFVTYLQRTLQAYGSLVPSHNLRRLYGSTRTSTSWDSQESRSEKYARMQREAEERARQSFNAARGMG